MTASVSPLALALRAAMLGLTLTGLSLPALAEQAASQAEVQRHWQIAAGPLVEALDQLARQAGVSLSYSEADVSDKLSPGVQGEASLTEALEQVLSGAGLQVQQQSSSAFVLVPVVAGDDALNLGSTQVIGNSLGGVTEGSGAYTTGLVSIGKMPQSLRRTPQSVSVLTEQRMKDQNLTNLTDMLYQAPGVVVDYTDSERVNYYTRGYEIDSIQFDGATFAPNAGWGNFIQPDIATLDHIEVLRGASGMLRGAGNPSGTVNMVRKRPTREFQGSASYTVGSWNAQRYVMDLSGPLIDGGALRGRIIAVHDDKDSFQDVKMERKNVLYTVLAADLSDSTTLTTGMEYSELDATGSWGNLAANVDGSAMDFSRDTFLGADWARWDRTNLHLFSELEHRFDNDWTLRLSAARARFAFKDHGFQQTYIYRSSTDPNLFTVSATINDGGGRTITDNLQGSLDGPFQLLGREHRLVLGVERNQIDQIGVESGFVTLGDVDIRTWDPSSIARPSVTYGDPTTSKTTQNAAYATASFSLSDPLTLMLGARLNWYDYESSSDEEGYSVDREIVPYAALVYDLTEQISAYASYTEIFKPQEAYSTSGLLDPMTGEVYEIGLKGEFYQGRLNSSLALFRTNMVGEALEDTTSPNPCTPYYTSGYCQVASGKTRSEGVELELSGEVLPDWQVTAGYTYTETKVLKDTAETEGKALRSNDPKHLFKLFTTYRLPGQLAAWTVGGGVQAQSDIYAVSGSARSEQGGYAIYNAMLGYRFNDHYSLQFNVNNLFDKYYYKKVGSGVNYYYGDPRNFALTLRGEF